MTLALLFWRPQLGPLLSALLVLLVAGWLIWVHRRFCKRFDKRRARLLIIPKVILAILLLIAFFDPSWAMVEKSGEKNRVLAVVDTSTSMDVKDIDNTSRNQRARSMVKALQKKLDGDIEFDLMVFDDELRKEESGEDERNTDIGRCLIGLHEKPDMADYLGVLMLTDGGDERIKPVRLPKAPLYVVGVGAEPSNTNDIVLAGVDAPTTVEQDVAFEVVVELAAYGNSSFMSELGAVAVKLEENVDGEWEQVGESNANLTPLSALVKFEVKGDSELGFKTFRVTAESKAGELTAQNNSREFSLQVRDRKINVLLYTRQLGWDVNKLRTMIGRDKGIFLTALSRLAAERYLVQGDRQKNDHVLEAGFPSKKDGLEMYDVVVLGSFPASDLNTRQQEALLEYVNDGGGLALLGGDHSFGLGDYAASPLAPVFPWVISALEPKLQAGSFPIRIPIEASEQDMIRGFASSIAEVGQMSLESVNLPGPLKAGAISLVETTVAGESIPTVALQPYGEGEVLGVASNTMWRWDRRGGAQREAYETFWKHALRHLAGQDEGGRFLSIRWDQEAYRPNEQAEVTIHVAGRYSSGELRLDATGKFGEQTSRLMVEAVGGRENTYRCKPFFYQRGDYQFDLVATAGEKELEHYKRVVRVGPTVNEGGKLDVNHAYLESLASRASGVYAKEADFEDLIDPLINRVIQTSITKDVSLLQYGNIFLILVLLVLISEWVIRRKLNLF